MIHETAAAGFSAGADAYERGRPSYPAVAVDLLVDELGIGPGRDVLDLAAGTGKLTQLLVATGAHVVAVEPVAEMRARLRDVEALEGTAESIPRPDASFDAVTVAQAFHWFDAPTALAEIQRVLRPGGGLGLVWNERDEATPWVAELSDLYNWGVERPYPKGVDWAAIVDASGRFTPCAHRQFLWSQEIDADTLVARVLSTSYVATWPAARQAGVEADVRALVAAFGATFSLPYVTDVYWCSARS